MDISALKSFQFLKHLSDQQLILLVNNSEILKLKKGEQLLEAGDEDEDEYFLLAGELDLKDPSKKVGGIRTLQANTPEALNALTRERPRPFRVLAHSPAAVLKVNLEHLKSILSEVPIESYEVKQILREDQPADKQMFFDIYSDLRNNKLALPSLPDVALNVRKMIDSGDNAKTIAQAVNIDPAITVKLIKAANSPLFRGTKEFETSAQAIVRLGLQTTKQLVTSFTLREVFKTKEPIIKKRMDALWQHSIEVAAICQVLAKQATKLDAELGMLAGLLHDIGSVPLLIYAAEYPSLVNNEDMLNSALVEYGPNLGGVILKRWNFKEEMVLVAQHAHDWRREHEGPADYCDLVQVAKLHAMMGNRDPEIPAMETSPAFKKISQDNLTPEASMKILDDAKQQIHETRQLLTN
ncbi:MAG: HDOD domain-containing protein [Pseudomonadales bacterium]|nr:HDOD domain-containing protein [Pseudomonadales bacterium]